MSAVDDLVARLARVERQTAALSRRPRLAFSSVDDGAIEYYDTSASVPLEEDGSGGVEIAQLSAVVGRQFDGTTVAATLSGPTPPVPTTPLVTPSATGIEVTWDGLFVDGAVAPMDFSRVEVHVSTTSPFSADTVLTLYSSIETPRGATVPVVLGDFDPRYVALVTRSLAGKRSAQSATASGVAGGVTNDVIASVSVSKLTAGVLAADVLVAGDLSTALSGARSGFNAAGFYTYDDDEQLTFSAGGPTGAAFFRGAISGSTITGGTIRTAATGQRIELTDNGGLKAYGPDGTTVLAQIHNKDESNLPTGDFSGFRSGVGGGFRIAGPYSANDGTLAKIGGGGSTGGSALEIRAAGAIALGGGINLYENGAPGVDGDGDPFDGSVRTYTDGQTAVKILRDRTMVPLAIRAPRMRAQWTAAGTVTSRSLTTWAFVTGWTIQTFVAPPSGIVVIHLSMFLRVDTAGVYAMGDVEVREGDVQGAGTQVIAPSGICVNANTNWVTAAGFRRVSGLTPGATYHCRPLYSTNTAGQLAYASAAAVVVLPSM